MKKDCFSQDYVDALKFKECAACPLFEECTRTVSLKGARTASAVGQAFGYALVLAALVIAASRWSDMPNGAPWLAFIALVYALAILRSGKEYAERNQEEREQAAREADARTEGGASLHPAPAHH